MVSFRFKCPVCKRAVLKKGKCSDCLLTPKDLELPNAWGVEPSRWKIIRKRKW